MTKRMLQVNVIKRFMTEKQFDSFLDEYNDNKKTIGAAYRVVNDQDLMVLHDYKTNKMTFSELQRKYKLTPHKINASLRVAALSKI